MCQWALISTLTETSCKTHYFGFSINKKVIKTTNFDAQLEYGQRGWP